MLRSFGLAVSEIIALSSEFSCLVPQIGPPRQKSQHPLGVQSLAETLR